MRGSQRQNSFPSHITTQIFVTAGQHIHVTSTIGHIVFYKEPLIAICPTMPYKDCATGRYITPLSVLCVVIDNIINYDYLWVYFKLLLIY